MAEITSAKEGTLKNTSGDTAIYPKTKTSRVFAEDGQSVDELFSGVGKALTSKLNSTFFTTARQNAVDSGVNSTKVKNYDSLVQLGISFVSSTHKLTIGGNTYDLSSLLSSEPTPSVGKVYGTPIVSVFKYTANQVSNLGIGVAPTEFKVYQPYTDNGVAQTPITYNSIEDAIQAGVVLQFTVTTGSTYASVDDSGNVTILQNTGSSTRNVVVSVKATMNDKTSAAKLSSTITQAATLTPSSAVLLSKEITYYKATNKYGYTITTKTRETDGTISSSSSTVYSTGSDEIYNHYMYKNDSGAIKIGNSDSSSEDYVGAADEYMLTSFIECEGAKSVKVENTYRSDLAHFFSTNASNLSGYVSTFTATTASRTTSETMNLPTNAKYVRLNVFKYGTAMFSAEYKATIIYNE